MNQIWNQTYKTNIYILCLIIKNCYLLLLPKSMLNLKITKKDKKRFYDEALLAYIVNTITIFFSSYHISLYVVQIFTRLFALVFTK